MKVIGIDVGGTKIYGGLVDGERVIRARRIDTPPLPDEGVALLGNLIRWLRQGEDICAVGVGMAGFIDVDCGRVISSPNLSGWCDVPLREMLGKEVGLPIFIDNDVNCAALAELKLGAGIGKKDLIAVFPGTGVGGGIIVNGRLVRGASFCGAEIGHMPIMLDGPKCACGLSGCLEVLCSGPAIIKSTNRPLNSVSEVSKAADKGEEWAISALEQAGKYLAQGIAILVNALNPEMIVLGGGVIEASSRIFKIVKEKVPLMVLPQALKGLSIKRARLHNKAGLLGASLIAKEGLMGDDRR